MACRVKASSIFKSESSVHSHPPQVIEQALADVLSDVRTVVSDFPAMTARLELAIEQFEREPPPATAETNFESVAFLRWLSGKQLHFPWNS